MLRPVGRLASDQELVRDGVADSSRFNIDKGILLLLAE